MNHSTPSVGDEIPPSLFAFTDQFIEIPSSWLPKIAEEPMTLPIWGTVFLVNNRAHQATILNLLQEIEYSEDENLSDHWYAVGDTGFVACQIDDRVFLGVDGAGYCFFKAHWEPLFKLTLDS